MLKLKSKLSHRLFSALFLVAVIPVCLMGYGTYRTAQSAMMNNAYMHIHTMAQVQAGQMDKWFEERLNDIRVLSELSTTRELCSAVCATQDGNGSGPPQSGLLSNLLALTRARSPSYESIHIIGPSGEILTSTKPDSEMLKNFRYMKDLELSIQAGESTLTPAHQHSDRKWYMHLVAPVTIQETGMQVFILAILDASATLDPILSNRAGLGSTGETYLVNEEARIITESRYLSRAETLSRPLESTGVREALARREGTAVYLNYLGREVIGSHLWLPRYRWGLLVEMGRDEILSPLQHIRMAILGTTGAVTLLCVLVALTLSRRISRPIIQMAEASRHMAGGSLEQRITCRGSDEVATLSESFNAMAERLSTLIDSLRRKEQSLRQAYDDLLEAQQQLVQSEKMAAVGELVASVVHEMRGPLSSVKLNFQIIGRTVSKGGSLSEHYRIGLDQIAQLERMFSDLLDYSRPIALESRPLRLEEILEQSLRQLEGFILEHKVSILTDLADDLPPVVGDPDKVRQVLVNLIRNAVEASQEGGSIGITARSAASHPAAASAERPSVTVEITDSGSGISAQDLKRIYQPFFTTKKKGTGLGLSIVKKILEAHGFSMTIQSEEGRGTLVKLSL